MHIKMCEIDIWGLFSQVCGMTDWPNSKHCDWTHTGSNCWNLDKNNRFYSINPLKLKPTKLPTFCAPTFHVHFIDIAFKMIISVGDLQWVNEKLVYRSAALQMVWVRSPCHLLFGTPNELVPVWPKPLPWPVLIYSSYCLLKHIKITSHHTKLMMNHHRRRSVMTLTHWALLKMATSLQSEPWCAFYWIKIFCLKCHQSDPSVQLTIIYHWLMPQSYPTTGLNL